MSTKEYDSDWLDAVAGAGSGRFAPHGQCRVRRIGDIVHYELTGPFNIEFIGMLGALRARLAEGGHLPQGRYASLVIFKGSLLMTPEALEAYRSLDSRATASVSACVVPLDAEGRSVMLDELSAIWKHRQMEVRLFANAEEALAWLRVRLKELEQA